VCWGLMCTCTLCTLDNPALQRTAKILCRLSHGDTCDAYVMYSLNHGRRSRGTRGTCPPRIWSRGTLVQIVPLRFLSYRYKKERSVAFKIRQNPFSAGALPGHRWGSSRRSPRPLSRLERGHPNHIPPHSAPTHLWRSPCVPLRIPARCSLCS